MVLFYHRLFRSEDLFIIIIIIIIIIMMMLVDGVESSRVLCGSTVI